jgi:hypothetical protein
MGGKEAGVLVPHADSGERKGNGGWRNQSRLGPGLKERALTDFWPNFPWDKKKKSCCHRYTGNVQGSP